MADAKLSHEDRIVWEKVARTVRPLTGRDALARPPAETMADMLAEAPAGRGPARRELNSPERATPAAPRQPPPAHPIDRPTLRKLARGRLALEARIDLHGLKRSEAHNLLLDFLSRAHERGLRHVLVITGKGSSPASEGVLRRDVPLWLSKPEFRPLVSGVEASAAAHGGHGALYVRLRRIRGGAQ